MDWTLPLPLAPDWALTRQILQRAMALIYLNAFVLAWNQAPALIGEHGLLPMRTFLPRVRFIQAPSLFFLSASNTMLTAMAGCGILVALWALSGWSERFGLAVSMITWTVLWALQLSFVNSGQTFWGFGWETLLAESGFLMIFLGPASMSPSALMPWLFRWLLFRLMFGAGMIKIRGDSCWRDLTCMYYHYETQPLPNPLSWFFAHVPRWLHRGEVAVTHAVELAVPFGFFAPAPWRYGAALITIVFQTTLILSGNLAWLNFITIVLCLPCFDDRFFHWLGMGLPSGSAVGGAYPWFHQALMGLLGSIIALLSIRPALNLLSSSQMMNASFEPLHLVNTYGAFGSVTRVRHEVILQGTSDPAPTAATQWHPYEFKCKPGAVDRLPCQVAPYYYKLDWQIWFAAMSNYWDHPWIINLVAKLLKNDPDTLALMDGNPFPEAPPKYIRAELYEYRFTESLAPQTVPMDQREALLRPVAPDELRRLYWHRSWVASYLPPLALDNGQLQSIVRDMGWD